MFNITAFSHLVVSLTICNGFNFAVRFANHIDERFTDFVKRFFHFFIGHFFAVTVKHRIYLADGDFSRQNIDEHNRQHAPKMSETTNSAKCSGRSSQNGGEFSVKNFNHSIIVRFARCPINSVFQAAGNRSIIFGRSD